MPPDALADDDVENGVVPRCDGQKFFAVLHPMAEGVLGARVSNKRCVKPILGRGFLN